ncbi:MAG: regulatory signaling modulator protein AmpE [Lysobacterales bacterium]
MSAALVAVVLSLVLDHLAPAAQRLRQHDVAGALLRDALEGLGRQPSLAGRWGWLPALALPLLVLAALQWLLSGWLYGLPGFLMQLAVLFLCWGPRDLDLDVEAVASAPDADARRQALVELSEGGVDSAPSGTPLVHTVFRQGLSRWFGVLFWFLLLGAFGALMYRLAQLAARERTAAPEAQQEPLRRFALLLDWAPAQLMCLALALAAHFDAVLAAWRDWHAGRGHGWFVLDLGFLDVAARASVREELIEEALDEGLAPPLDAELDAAEASLASATEIPAGALRELRDAMSLVWRVLLVWLSVLALFVLAGYVG